MANIQEEVENEYTYKPMIEESDNLKEYMGRKFNEGKKTTMNYDDYRNLKEGKKNIYDGFIPPPLKENGSRSPAERKMKEMENEFSKILSLKEQTIGQLKQKNESLNEFKDAVRILEEKNAQLKEKYILLEDKFKSLYESIRNSKEDNQDSEKNQPGNNQSNKKMSEGEIKNIEEIIHQDSKNKMENEELHWKNVKLEEANINLQNENNLLILTLDRLIESNQQEENPKKLEELKIPEQIYTIIQKFKNQNNEAGNNPKNVFELNKSKSAQNILSRNENYIKELEKTLNIKSNSINEYKNLLEALKLSKESISLENTNLQKKNDELEQRVEELEGNHNKNTRENEVLRIRLDISKRQLEALSGKVLDKNLNEKIKTIIDDGCHKNSQFIDVLKEYQIKTEELTNQLSKLQDEYKAFVSSNFSPPDNYKKFPGDLSGENEIKKLRTQLQYSMKEYRDLRIMYEQLIIEKNENEERFLSSKLALADENTNFKLEQDRLDKALKSLSLDYNQIYNENEILKKTLKK